MPSRGYAQLVAGDRFHVFISYAREASSELALDVQTGLERFAKPWNKLRAVRVFRDDASMSANTALWTTIQRALQESEWFVLVATPPAAASEYVNNEVAWWVTHKGAHRLLLVHAAGTIAWDRYLCAPCFRCIGVVNGSGQAATQSLSLVVSCLLRWALKGGLCALLTVRDSHGGKGSQS